MLQVDQHYHDGVRRTWADGKTLRLEYLLNDFLAGVVACAAAEKARREEHGGSANGRKGERAPTCRALASMREPKG